MSNFSAFHWIIVAVVIIMLYGAFKSMAAGFKHGSSTFCTTCGHEGPTRTHTKGSLGIEIVLWLCFIVPGLIYTIWRVSSRGEICSSCGAHTLVPADSPVAVKMRKDLSST